MARLEDQLLSDSNTDRRAHPRYPSEVEVQGTPEEGGVVARMVASNLSMGGLQCTSTADFPEMTRLAVRLMLPTKVNGRLETRPVDVEAVVVRREPMTSASSGEERFELALFFTGVSTGDREILGRYLERQTASA
jgi:hypothetical protein